MFTVGLTLVVTAILLVLGYLLATAVNRLRRMRPIVLGILLLLRTSLPDWSARRRSPGSSTPTSAASVNYFIAVTSAGSGAPVVHRHVAQPLLIIAQRRLVHAARSPC